MHGDKHGIVGVVLVRLQDALRPTGCIALQAKHDGLLLKRLDVASGQIAFDCIEVEGLIGAANGEDMTVQVVVGDTVPVH